MSVVQTLAATALALLLAAGPASAGCNKHTPCPVITFNPAMPVELDVVPVGAVLATVNVTLNPASAGQFRGTTTFGPPYGNAGGLLALSGSDIVLVAPFPPGYSIQNATLVANQ